MDGGHRVQKEQEARWQQASWQSLVNREREAETTASVTGALGLRQRWGTCAESERTWPEGHTGRGQRTDTVKPIRDLPRDHQPAAGSANTHVLCLAQ